MRHEPKAPAIVQFDRVQRAVSRAYVERVADEKTLDLVHAIEGAIADVEAEVAERRRTTRERDGRKVVGMLLSTSIVALVIAVLSSIYNYTDQGYCAQLGAIEGWAAGQGGNARAAALSKQFCFGGDYLDFIPSMASAALIEGVDDRAPHPAPPRKR